MSMPSSESSRPHARTLTDRQGSGAADDLGGDDGLFFLDEDDLQTVFQDDYYARLNLDHNASQEEIRNSYRRLSRLLHPDKHTEAWKKSLADDAFNRINVAYEVLRDPYRKSMYDACGSSGLTSEVWQMVPADPSRLKNLEQLKEEREKRKEKESTNPHNEVSMGLDMTDLFEGGDRDRKDYGIQNYIPHVEITTLNTMQSIEAPWPQVDRLQVFSNVNYERGTGGGMLGVDISKTISESVVTDYKFMTGPGRGMVAHFKVNRRLGPSRSICFSAFSAFSRFGMMPLMEIAYGSSLGKLGSGRLVIRGSSRVVSVFTRVDKEFKNAKLAISSEGFLGISYWVKYSPFCSCNYKIYVEISHHNAKMSQDDIVFGISSSYKLDLVYEPKITLGVKVGFRGASLEYGISRRVSKYNQLAATMNLALPGGVSLRITFQRSNQAFSFPILLSNDILPAPVFYGTITPLIIYACVRSLYLVPKWKAYIKSRLNSRRNAYESGLEEKRKEYTDFIRLMADKYEEMLNAEGLSNGLVIDRALYGKFGDSYHSTADTINVQVQLQCLVRNHKLDLPALPKNDLPGFYDPCMGEAKRIEIHYVFGGKHHLIQASEDEAIHLPDIAHLLIG